MAISRTFTGRSTGGSSVWGSVPNPVQMPNPLSDIRRAVPNFDQLTALLSGNLMSGLQGMIAPDVSRAVIDAANSRAVAGGFGGSGLGRNLEARDLGLTSKQIQDQAFAQALPFFQTQQRVGTLDPSIQAGISQYNSVLAAMPDPVKRAEFIANQQAADAKKANFTPLFGSNTAIPVGGGQVSPGSLDWTRWMNSMGGGATPFAFGGGSTVQNNVPISINPAVPQVSSQVDLISSGNPTQQAAEEIFSYNLGPSSATPSFTQGTSGVDPGYQWPNLFENPNGGSNIQNILRSALGDSYTPSKEQFAYDPYESLAPI